LQQGRHPPVDTLVDVTQIEEMCALEVRGDHLFIGAARPLNEVVASPIVQMHAQALYEAAGLIGGPQVRNTATLGGNVAHALPAADGAVSLVSLDAKAEVASPDGRRVVPMLDLYAGPGKSTLDPRREVLVGFRVALRKPGQASAFRRVMRPQGVAIAILNLGVWIERKGDQIVDARIAIGPAGPKPLRARAAEAALWGRSYSPETMQAAAEALLGEAKFRTSPHRATAEYRRHTACVLLEQTLSVAWQRAGSEG
jgi:carbon-monoxide dehydrogenase medium subunit